MKDRLAQLWKRFRSQRERTPLLRRSLRLLVGGVVVLYGSYLALVNVLLWSGGLGWLLHQLAPPLRLETGRSYTLWFFRVELRDLHLSVMDPAVHVELEVPRGSVQVRPDQLFASRFHTSHFAGRGFVFRLRPNYEKLPEERREALPDLPDASKPLIEEVTPPEELWGLVFEGLDVDFEEIWISEFRMKGLTHVRGGFVLRPELELEIFPTEVRFATTELRFGSDRTVAQPFEGTVNVQMPRTRFDDSLPWPEVSFRSDLAAEWTDLTFVNAYLTEPGGPRIEEGRADTEFEAKLEQDALRLRGDTSWHQVRFENGTLRARFDAIVSGRFRGKGSGFPVGQLTDGVADVSRVDLMDSDFDVEAWSLRIDLPELAFEHSPLEVSGPFMAAAEDARPVAKVLGIPSLPGPLEDFLRLPDLGVVGSVYLTNREQMLDVQRATSETIDVRGRFVRVQDALYSAVLLKADPLGVGVYTGPDDSGFHMRADDEWLEQELEKLP